MVCTIIACKKVNCDEVTYAGTIQPIVQSNCTASGCHGAGSAYGDFTSYANLYSAVSFGKIKERVLEEKDMPSEGKLTRKERKQMECWINNGAPNN
jgi:uncharacterized membrane protein